MKCIECEGNLRVVDKREIGKYSRRRRECEECGRRYTYYEIPENEFTFVKQALKILDVYEAQIQRK